MVNRASLVYSLLYAAFTSVLVVSVISVVDFTVGALVMGWPLNVFHYILVFKMKPMLVSTFICCFGFALYLGKERLWGSRLQSKLKYAALFFLVSYLTYYPLLDIDRFLLSCRSGAIDPLGCLVSSLDGQISLKFRVGVSLLNPFRVESLLLVLCALMVVFVSSPTFHKLSSFVVDDNDK